jgi:cyclopropane-fatty-acyl-phospholipid synthase
VPSLSDLRRRIVDRTDFRVAILHDITDHYSKTLRLWRGCLVENRSRLQDLAYPERLLRMWEHHCYCGGGFLEQMIGDVPLLRPQT